MKKNEDLFGYEEEFHAKDRKLYRKERKRVSLKDRSKFKKSDQDQLKKRKEKLSSAEPISNLLRGRVLAITLEGILVDTENQFYLCSLKGALKQEYQRVKNLVAIGDFVQFSPQENFQGVIHSIEERRSVLSRADTLSRQKEQFIAVNIDQVLITASVVLPSLKPFLIDRYIIAAKKGNMQPLVVVNKIDLFQNPPEGVSTGDLQKEKELYLEFLKTYRDLLIPVFPVSTVTGEGIEVLKEAMRGKASVFSGQSGVGKSSLINAVTGSHLEVGKLVEKTSKGSHTTTTSHLLPLESGGFCIDTPGIKSFGLWDLSKEEIQDYFPEIFQLGRDCKYPDCSHLQEPQCAVRKALLEKKISRLRFDSYCALMTDLSQEHRHR